MTETNQDLIENVTITSTTVQQNIQSRRTSIMTRLHAGYFTITLSLGGQALLWKAFINPNHSSSRYMTTSTWHVFNTCSSVVFVLLWWLSLLMQTFISITYLVRCICHFNLVKAEFLHYVGVNYFYAPWISWTLLLQSSPMFVDTNVRIAVCFALAIPVLTLDIKLYGQWFTTERKFLFKLGNHTSQISVLANLFITQAAAQVGCKETAICMFSLGIVHYLVIFVTLYQRLSGGDNTSTLLLRPALLLHFAVPSVACLAWNCVTGAFDMMSKMLFFFSLFLFLCLACRPTMFKKSMKRFNVVWWNYSFTLTFLALASNEYAKEVKGPIAYMLMIVLSVLSVLGFLGSMLITAFNINKLLRENDPLMNFSNHLKTQDLI